MGYYVIKFMSWAYTLKKETAYDGQISTAVKLVVKEQYMNFMQYNTNWYWEKLPQQNNIIVPTRIVVHPCLYVINTMEVEKSKSVYNKTKHTRLYKGVLYF